MGQLKILLKNLAETGMSSCMIRKQNKSFGNCLLLEEDRYV